MLPPSTMLFSADCLSILSEINNSGMKLGMNYSHTDVRHTVNALCSSYGPVPHFQMHQGRKGWGVGGTGATLSQLTLKPHSHSLSSRLRSSNLPAFFSLSTVPLSLLIHTQFSFHSFLSPRLHACRARRFCLKETTQGQG